MEYRYSGYITTILILIIVVGMVVSGCGKKEGFGVQVTAFNSSLEATDQIDVLDTLLVGVNGLKPLTQYDLQIYRADGTPLFEGCPEDTNPIAGCAAADKIPIPVKLTTDANGNIPPTALWTDAGVDAQPDEEVDKSKLQVKSYKIVLQGEGLNITLPFFTINNINQPKVWASDVNGNVENSFRSENDPSQCDKVYVTGMNFPTKDKEGNALTVDIYVVEDKSRWSIGDTIIPPSSPEMMRAKLANVAVNSDGTIGPVEAWTVPANVTADDIREFDIIVDINKDGYFNQDDYKDAQDKDMVNVRDAADNTLATGFVVQLAPPSPSEHIVQNLSSTGTIVSYYPPDYFGYADTFDVAATGTGQNYYSSGPGLYTYFNSLINYGTLKYWQMVRIWIVSEQSWQDIIADSEHKIHPSMDVSGGFENVHVQYKCFNSLPYLIWPAPLTVGEYYIIIDVNHNNKYDYGIDVVDGFTTGGTQGVVTVTNPATDIGKGFDVVEQLP